MNRDVFLSILALDAYNRGYGAGLNGLQSSGQIGAASIIRESDTGDGSPGVNAGFYAIAYNWDGETIVSYRGTSFPSDLPYPRHCEATQSPWKSRAAPREAFTPSRQASVIPAKAGIQLTVLS